MDVERLAIRAAHLLLRVRPLLVVESGLELCPERLTRRIVGGGNDDVIDVLARKAQAHLRIRRPHPLQEDLRHAQGPAPERPKVLQHHLVGDVGEQVTRIPGALRQLGNLGPHTVGCAALPGREPHAEIALVLERRVVHVVVAQEGTLEVNAPNPHAMVRCIGDQPEQGCDRQRGRKGAVWLEHLWPLRRPVHCQPSFLGQVAPGVEDPHGLQHPHLSRLLLRDLHEGAFSKVTVNLGLPRGIPLGLQLRTPFDHPNGRVAGVVLDPCLERSPRVPHLRSASRNAPPPLRHIGERGLWVQVIRTQQPTRRHKNAVRMLPVLFIREGSKPRHEHTRHLLICLSPGHVAPKVAVHRVALQHLAQEDCPLQLLLIGVLAEKVPQDTQRTLPGRHRCRTLATPMATSHRLVHAAAPSTVRRQNC